MHYSLQIAQAERSRNWDIVGITTGQINFYAYKNKWLGLLEPNLVQVGWFLRILGQICKFDNSLVLFPFFSFFPIFRWLVG